MCVAEKYMTPENKSSIVQNGGYLKIQLTRLRAGVGRLPHRVWRHVCPQTLSASGGSLVVPAHSAASLCVESRGWGQVPRPGHRVPEGVRGQHLSLRRLWCFPVQGPAGYYMWPPCFLRAALGGTAVSSFQKDRMKPKLQMRCCSGVVPHV